MCCKVLTKNGYTFILQIFMIINPTLFLYLSHKFDNSIIHSLFGRYVGTGLF